MQAEMSVRILPDGTIKVVTDGPVPEEHHQNAEEFIKFLEQKLGGARTTEKLREGQHHHHHHNHQDQHHHH